MAPVASLRHWKAVEAWAKRQLASASAAEAVPCLIEPEQFLAPWATPLLIPQRYKVLHGGRGSGKSWAVADALLIEGARRKCRILCAREFQVSIKDSVHFLLKERIEELGLSRFYDAQETTILGGNGTTFIFKGLRHNVQSIKSTAGVTHCWVEEAQTISAESWRILTPTIRNPGSEIWVTFNPAQKSDPMWQEFIEKQRSNAWVLKVNWDQNPWFPAVLDDERREMAATDPDLYRHIWEGEPLERSDAQILAGKWVIDAFTPGDDWDGPYHGADWGFGSDPTTLVKLWIAGKRLYVERESCQHRLELDETAQQWRQDVPDCERYVIPADNSRPESISHVRRNGIPRLVAADKWPGSVEDGIAYLRSFEAIVVHPRCTNFAQECRLYSHKVDRLTGEVLPDIVDKYNHLIDSARYALVSLIKARATPERRRSSSRSNW